MAENVIPRKFRFKAFPEKARQEVIYPEVIAWYGALTVAKLTGDEDLGGRQLDENANLKEVCVGTNKGFDEKFYLDRPRTAGDLHGQSPMMWTASALLR